ncbi:MAG: Rrf2 family transcriptional regulator [Blastocatellia bacterium]|nr:Rrf2 family transcriptional regulator [Blastocatellia bacterium]
MRIASRFAIAVHILSLLGTFPEESLTSDWMASSIGVNAVIVRNVIGMLRRAGLVTTQQGAAGAFLARPLQQITVLDVYRAIGMEDDLFTLHQSPNPNCPVGRNIQRALGTVFTKAQQEMEAQLAKTTMAQIVREIKAADKP